MEIFAQKLWNGVSIVFSKKPEETSEVRQTLKNMFLELSGRVNTINNRYF